MKTLVIGDSHIEESSIEELSVIFDEILNIKADRVIHLGDLLEKKNPSAIEVKFATYIADKFSRKYSEIIILTGNHNEVNKDLSCVDYLSYFGNINIYKFFKDKDYFGHFCIAESDKSYGDIGLLTKQELLYYRFSLLGHQHSFQEIVKDKLWHLGSIIFQTFAETGIPKRVALIDDNKNNIEFIELKSPIPMLQLNSIDRLSTLSSRLKVKIVYTDYEVYKKELNLLPRFKDYFYKFIYELKFEKEIVKIKKDTAEDKSLITKWLQQIKDKEVQSLLTSVMKD